MSIRKNEKVWTTYKTDKQTYIITSDQNRTTYYLYQHNGTDYEKTKHKASNPLELEKWIINVR